MRHEFYDALDRESVQGVRKALKLLETFGFETRSSPMLVLLDSGIDWSLTCVEELRRVPLSPATKLRVNPTLTFSEDFSDSLGNPLQETKYHPTKGYKFVDYSLDSDAQGFFISLAELLVRVKGGSSFKDSFAESFKDFFPPSTSERTVSRTKTKRETIISVKNTVDSYYRRQRQRLKKSKTN